MNNEQARFESLKFLDEIVSVNDAPNSNPNGPVSCRRIHSQDRLTQKELLTDNLQAIGIQDLLDRTTANSISEISNDPVPRGNTLNNMRRPAVRLLTLQLVTANFRSSEVCYDAKSFTTWDKIIAGLPNDSDKYNVTMIFDEIINEFTTTEFLVGFMDPNIRIISDDNELHKFFESIHYWQTMRAIYDITNSSNSDFPLRLPNTFYRGKFTHDPRFIPYIIKSTQGLIGYSMQYNTKVKSVNKTNLVPLMEEFYALSENAFDKFASFDRKSHFTEKNGSGWYKNQITQIDDAIGGFIEMFKRMFEFEDEEISFIQDLRTKRTANISN